MLWGQRFTLRDVNDSQATLMCKDTPAHTIPCDRCLQVFCLYKYYDVCWRIGVLYMNGLPPCVLIFGALLWFVGHQQCSCEENHCTKLTSLNIRIVSCIVYSPQPCLSLSWLYLSCRINHFWMCEPVLTCCCPFCCSACCIDDLGSYHKASSW